MVVRTVFREAAADAGSESVLAYLASRSVTTVSGCWIWTGPVNHAGYGVSWLPGFGRKRVFRVHRIAYAAAFRDPRHDVEHLCHNRLCWNPSHLVDCVARVNRQQGSRNRWRFWAEIKRQGRDFSAVVGFEHGSL